MTQSKSRQRGPSVPISRSRRMLFRLLIVCATLLVCEISCFVVVWIRSGEPVFWSGWIERHNELIERYSSKDEIAAAKPNTGRVFEDHTGTRRNMLHPYLGYVCDPTQTRFANRFGFRGTDPLQHRSDDKLVVAVLGGSLAEGFAFDGMPSVELELRKLPQFRHKKIVVVNLASGGYKQPQQLLALNLMLSFGAQYDIVINIDGFNDVALHEVKNVDAGTFPAYPYLWYEYVQPYTDSTTRRLVGRKAFLTSQIVSLARSSLKVPLRYSITWNAFTSMRQKRFVRSLFDTELELRDHLATIDSHDLYYVKGPHVDLNTDERFAFLAAVWRRCSIQLDRLCRANGIRYFHFLQPNQYVADSKTMGAVERARAYKEDAIYKPGVEQGYPLLIEEGKKLLQSGVRFVDLTKVFIDIEEPVYADDCCHLDFNGKQLMAATVAQAILDDFQATP